MRLAVSSGNDCQKPGLPYFSTGSGYSFSQKANFWTTFFLDSLFSLPGFNCPVPDFFSFIIFQAILLPIFSLLQQFFGYYTYNPGICHLTKNDDKLILLNGICQIRQRTQPVGYANHDSFSGNPHKFADHLILIGIRI